MRIFYEIPNGFFIMFLMILKNYFKYDRKKATPPTVL